MGLFDIFKKILVHTRSKNENLPLINAARQKTP